MHPAFLMALHNPQAWIPRGASHGALGQQYVQAPYFGYAHPQPGFGFAGGALTASEIAYLQDRALRFQQVLDQVNEVPVGHTVSTTDGREMVAMLTALAIFGDDYNYVTGQPSVGYNANKSEAAFNLVRDNIQFWYQQYFAPVPTPRGTIFRKLMAVIRKVKP